MGIQATVYPTWLIPCHHVRGLLQGVNSITMTLQWAWWRFKSPASRLFIVLLKRLLRRRSKNASKIRVTGLCAGNSPGTRKQRASNAENFSIWWRHHATFSDNYAFSTISQELQTIRELIELSSSINSRAVNNSCEIVHHRHFSFQYHTQKHYHNVMRLKFTLFDKDFIHVA